MTEDAIEVTFHCEYMDEDYPISKLSGTDWEGKEFSHEAVTQNIIGMCDSTGQWHPVDDLVDTYDGQVCQDEINNGTYVECADVIGYRLREDCISMDSEYIFDSSYYVECDNCDEMRHEDMDCWNCGFNDNNRDSGFIEYSGDPLEFINTNALFSHAKTGDLRKKGQIGHADKDVVYLGIEIETEPRHKVNNRRQAGSRLSKIFGDTVALKDDGSLRDGIEIVSGPMTLAKHKEFWLDRKMSEFLNSENGTEKRCGIHVHLSREALSCAHQARLGKFVNSGNNRQFVVSAARRDNNSQWASYNDMPNMSKYIDEGNRHRYRALNYCNAGTLEFRIFDGSTQYAKIMSSLEFVHACVEFTRICGNNNLGWESFWDFATNGKNRKEYKHFIEYMKEHCELVKVPVKA